ncbi:MAG: lanthionine synthetase LanC family protein [Aequorivita sp.]
MKKEIIIKITQSFNRRILTENFDSDDFHSDFFEGILGVVYYLSTINSILKDEAFNEKIADLINIVFNRVSSGDYLISRYSNLSYGLSGLGYVIHDLVEKGMLDEVHLEPFIDIDLLIYKSALKDIESGNFDFMNGVPGVLFYFNAKNSNYRDEIIDKMYAKLETVKYPFYNHISELYNKGINFGIAHGLVGLLLVLANIYEEGNQTDHVKQLMEHCIKIILESQVESTVNGKKIYYPYNLYYNETGELINQSTTRLAWCSGDLAVSLALCKIGTLLEKKDCLELSDQLGQSCVQRRTLPETGIHLPIFCHGSSGAACMYKKLYELTSKEHYLTEYNYWFTQTLEYLEDKVNSKDKNDFNMILGLTGAVLMINNIEDLISGWDKIFLI